MTTTSVPVITQQTFEVAVKLKNEVFRNEYNDFENSITKIFLSGIHKKMNESLIIRGVFVIEFISKSLTKGSVIYDFDLVVEQSKFMHSTIDFATLAPITADLIEQSLQDVDDVEVKES